MRPPSIATIVTKSPGFHPAFCLLSQPGHTAASHNENEIKQPLRLKSDLTGTDLILLFFSNEGIFPSHTGKE